MWIVTVKLPSRKTWILAAAAAAAALLVTGAALLAFRPASSGASAPGEAGLECCLTCLEEFGWEVDPTPTNVESFTLSSSLSASYLELQLEAGYDLRDDMDCVVTRYTFQILNYPTGEEGVCADLLVREGAVVGGDVRTTDLDGFMHALCRPD